MAHHGGVLGHALFVSSTAAIIIGTADATLATVLRDAGWSAFRAGKHHNVLVDALDMIERGVLAKDTALTPLNPMTPGTCLPARR